MTPTKWLAAPFLDDRFPLPLDQPFSAGQARSAGLRSSTLSLLVGQGLVRRVLFGVYAPAQLPDTTATRGQALALVARRGSVVVDWTACWYWTGVDRPNSHLAVPALTVFRMGGGTRLRRETVASGLRTLARDEVVPLCDGLMVTTPLRTAWDLGRFAPPIIGLGGMDALMREGGFTLGQLVAGVERFRKQRGVVQLRLVAPCVDGLAESPSESALRWRWLETPGMPPPELQISIPGSDGAELARLDLGVRELRFAAEYDGEAFHGEAAAEHDARRRTNLDEVYQWTIEVFRRKGVYGRNNDCSRRLLEGVARARRRHAAL